MSFGTEERYSQVTIFTCYVYAFNFFVLNANCLNIGLVGSLLCAK